MCAKMRAMANANSPGPGARRDGALLEKRRAARPQPPRYKVVLFNDDYTPMPFVVALLEQVFAKSPVEANALMLRIHRSGRGTAGQYTLEIAETKVALVHRNAKEHGYPLRAGVEET